MIPNSDRKVECAVKGCAARVKGVDLLEGVNERGLPIWWVEYECEEGHGFTVEHEREGGMLCRNRTTG